MLILRIVSAALVLVSIIPMVRKDYWVYRIGEFPRAQKWVLNAALLLIYTWYTYPYVPIDGLFLGLLSINLGYLTYQIYPYLPIAKKQIQSVKKELKPGISLLIFNVFQYNEQYDKLDKLVKNNKPDLIVLVEADAVWKQACLSRFGSAYPYRILEDKDNTYGMLVFSRLELRGSKVRYLLNDEIPSMVTEVVLQGGRKVKLYTLHPAPPVPTLSRYSTERDAEILMVGKEAKEEKLPVIVAGDLNDVAWSYTTELFLKISELLDPRRGRGFFNTFHAKFFWARWPLDHVFCSAHFRLQEIRRLPASGSDHFPMYIQLYLAEEVDDTAALDADKEEEALAEEKIQNGKEADAD